MSGDVALTDLVIRAAVQHNWCALPPLVPGRNEIEIRSRDGAPASGSKFELVWEELGAGRALRRRLEGERTNCVVNVKGAAMPRMQGVTLSREQECAASLFRRPDAPAAGPITRSR
jgi:hypothetical protein